MKKLLLLNLLLSVACVFANAQSIDVMREGAAFSMISPNAQYIAGNIDDIAVYYNSETKFAASLEGENLDDGGCFVWDMNDKGQLAVDWKKQAALWSESEGFIVLPMPEGLNRKEKAYSAARCITADGKTVVVSFGDPTISVYVYTKKEDNIWDMVKLPMPEEDPIFHQIPQFASPMGINDDATRIMGRYRIDTGLEELPFAWEKTEEGEWIIRWVAMEFICKGGKTDAVYPGDFDWDGSGYNTEVEPGQEKSEWQEEYDKAYQEYEEKWMDYEATLRATATGYYWHAAGSLSGMRMSKNGRYVNAQISYERTNATYPAVIDLDADTVYVFTCNVGAGCLSVTNEGVISIQGIMDYFSWTYVSSIEDPTKSVTLTEYVMNKTASKINLADYMTYETPDGPRVAEGTATLSSSGNGLVTWQYNGFGDNQRYETVVVKYDAEVANEIVLESNLGVYPNPTEGILYLPEALEEVVVMDVTGRIVYTAASVESTIDLSTLTAGTYILMADREGNQVSTKVVVK